jgi:hypothetical protein
LITQSKQDYPTRRGITSPVKTDDAQPGEARCFKVQRALGVRSGRINSSFGPSLVFPFITWFDRVISNPPAMPRRTRGLQQGFGMCLKIEGFSLARETVIVQLYRIG